MSSRTAFRIALPLLLATLWVGRALGSDTIEKQFLSNVRQVTDGFLSAGEGYFSPDGRMIVYQAVPHGFPFFQIYAQPLGGGEVRRLSPGHGRTTCAYFAPGGRRVIFASSHLNPHLAQAEDESRNELMEFARSGWRRHQHWEFDPYMEIFSTDIYGKKLQRLTHSSGYDAECTFSPDGQKIVFCSNRSGDPELYIMDADGSNVRQLTDSKGYDGTPSFSPCGEWIAFSSDRNQTGQLQLYVIGVDGQNETALTEGDSSNWGPSWHPSGEYLAWTSSEAGGSWTNCDLQLMKLDRQHATIAPGKPVRITDHPATDVMPVFSPDGKQLMWTSNCTADGSSQLWIGDINLPGDNER